MGVVQENFNTPIFYEGNVKPKWLIEYWMKLKNDEN